MKFFYSVVDKSNGIEVPVAPFFDFVRLVVLAFALEFRNLQL